MAIDATLVVGEANASSSLTTTPQTTTNGRKFALCVSWDAGQTITGGVPSDSKSNTWSALGSQQADGNGGLLRWFITTTALGGSSHTFTVAFSGTAYPTVSVYELTDAGDVDVQTQSQDSGGQPFTMATGALAQAAEVVLVAASNNTGSDGAYSVNASTPTGSLLYSNGSVSANWTHGVAKYLPSSTSSFDPSFNRSGTSGGTSAISIISIEEAAGGGGGTTITPGAGSVTLSGTAPTVTATSLSRDRPTYVGGASQVGTGATITVDLTALSGGSDSSPSVGDLVVVVWGHADTSDRTLSVSTSGYTKRQDLYQTETWDPNLATAWKFMGSTPDSSVVVNRTSNAAYGGCAVVHVWRGVDPNVPFDVTDATAQGSNSQLANPGSITPLRENSVVLACGIGTQATTGAAFTIPSGMTNGVSVKSDGTTADAAVFLASYDWTSGAYDPAAVTGGTGGTSAGWIAVTMALRGAIADGAVEITPAAGALVLTAAAPTVTAPLLIRPGAGALTLTGTAPTLSSGSSPLITPAAGAIVLAGAVPVQTLTLPAPAPAALVLTGYAPTRLIGVNVTPGAGAVVLAGTAPTVSRTANQVVTPAAGATTLAGAAPTVTRTANQVVTPAAGSTTLAGAAPTVTRTANQSRTPAAGAIALSGAVPTVTRTASVVLTPAAGAITLSASAPDVTRSQSGQIQPPAASLVLTGAAPIVGGSFVVRPGAGQLVLGGAAPAVTAGSSRTITPAAAGLVLAGAAPVVGGSYVVRPAAGTVVLAGTTPNVTVSASGQIQPAPANVVLAGAAPIVGISYVIRPGAGATVLGGAAPTVTRTANVVAQPGAAAVLLSAAAPILVQTGNQVRTPAAGALLVTGALPQLVQSDAQAITPAAGSVVLIAFVPRVGQMFDMPRTARLGDLVAPGPDRRLGGRVAAGGARRLGARTAPN